MNSLVEFDQSAEDDKETVALRELLSFMERPQSIGLDSLKESLRNIVTLMLAIKGYETGFDLQHLLYGEHSSLAPEGILKTDKKKKQDIKDFWDMIAQLEREMATQFNSLFEKTAEKIIEIKHVINEKIAEIDASIERKVGALESANTKVEKTLIEKEIHKKKKKRSKLKEFKNHVKKQEVQLQEADSSEEIIGIQKNVIEDVDDFKAGRFNLDKDRSNPLGALGDVLNMRNASNDPVYNACYNETTTGSGSTETCESISDGTTSDGSGKKDDDIKSSPLETVL